MNQQKISAFLAWILLSLLLVAGPSFTLKHTLLSPSNVASAASTDITVSAAASIKEALEDIKPIYEGKKSDTTITLNLGSSGSLRQQIEQGAPVDLFISAATNHMDALQEKGLLLNETRRDLLRNRVVLIVPKNNPASVTSFADLTKDTVKKISIGEPESVPAGKYAKEVLTSVGSYEALKSKIVFAKDVRQVLNYVATGNVDAGIVYTTDAKISDEVKVIATAPETSHSPIVYPIAVIKDSKNAAGAKELEEFMFTSPARSVFEKYGFTMAS